MADLRDEYARQHLNAVRAGAAGRKGEVRQPDSFLRFTELDPILDKAVKKSMKTKESAPKKKKDTGRLKAKATGRSSASTGGQQGPPPKTARQKRLLDIGWQRYEDYMNKRWSIR